MADNDVILQEILDKVNALPQPMDETALNTQIRSVVDELTKDPEFYRKMRFTQEPEQPVIGSKYARYGLNVADIEFMYDMLESAKGRRLGGAICEGPSEELTRTFKAVSSALYMSDEEIRKIDRQAIDNLFPRVTKLNRKAYEEAMRAMDTAESGYGSQLVGAQYVGDLWGAATQESRVFGLFDTFEMTAPVAYLPVEVDFPEMLWVAENTSATSSPYATTKTGSNRVTVTAYKFIIHQIWSGEMGEDSIIPFIPFLRRQAQKSLAFYGDSLLLNGDTTNSASNINSDADPADTKHYLAFDGLRHVGLVDNTGNQLNQAGGITFAALRGSKGRMLDTTYLHDWGHPNNPADLVYIADPQTADQIATLDEVVNWKTMASRPLLNGEVAPVLGHPVISSIAMPLTGADGFVDIGSSTKGQIVAVNRNVAKVGWRRRVKVETENLIGRDQTDIMYSLRLGFGRFTPTGAASGIEGVDVIYDITL